MQIAERDAEDFLVEEQKGGKGLILSRGRDVSILGQEGLDFSGLHFCRVAFVMEEDETAHPVHTGLFGAVGVMFEAQDFAELVEEFFTMIFDLPVRLMHNSCSLDGLIHIIAPFLTTARHKRL